MRKNPQLPPVNCQYGAPMGRRSYGHIDDCGVDAVRLFRVRIDSQGYDEGGAYWGIGKALWCAMCEDEGYLDFVRAGSRREAAEALGIFQSQLITKERKCHA